MQYPRLEPYLRGRTWWAKGYVYYNGRPLGGYIRTSTRSLTEAGAKNWIEETEQREIRRHLVGDQAALTFADAVMLYRGSDEMAKALMPLVVELGDKLVKDITPKEVRALGPKLYPNNSTDSWRRWVITPVRSVINNAHDLGKCPPIRITGYKTSERISQDKKRGKESRIPKKPGGWHWLLQFREHAKPYHSALALLMFVTGARIGQAVRMRPDQHLDLQNAQVCIPAGKGAADRWVKVPMELVVELANLPPRVPKGWARKPSNLRVFGFASRSGPLSGWRTACKKAGIEYLPPHSAGRHGFGQEMHVRQGVDAQAVASVGGWSEVKLVHDTYTHPENDSGKILDAFRTGLVQAETDTGIKLLKQRRNS